MATTNIVDKDGNTIAASDATVPSDRHFRNAWTLSGKTKTEDLAESKKIFQEKIRASRENKLRIVEINLILKVVTKIFPFFVSALNRISSRSNHSS